MLALLSLLTTASAADVTFTWSARLLDSAGTPLDGAQTVTFRIANADPSPGTLQWTETYAVSAEEGYFTVVLGSASGDPLSDRILAARPVTVEAVVGGVSMGVQTLMDVPYAASVSPDAVTRALSAAACSEDGVLGWDAATGTLRVCDAGGWATVWSRTGDGTSLNPGTTCLQLLDDGHSTGDGPYWIDPDGPSGNAAFQAYCDMTTRGGGWTLVAHLGTITTNKTTTVGSTNWFPLFDDFGAYSAAALTTGAPFSRLDLFASRLKDDGEFLAYRTSNLNKKFIWPIADVRSWAQDILPQVPYIRLTEDGTNWFTRSNSLAVYNQGVHSYTGYDWNSKTSESGTNCDNCDNSFSTGLSHRGLLYWETGDDSYDADQWFHAQPLSLTDSTGPDNSAQDIAIFVRERP